MSDENEIQKSDFERYFPFTPTALAVKECARLTALRRYECPSPILDVGCGDGLFASIAFGGAEVWGIDIDAAEGRWAAASRAYSQVILGDVTSAHLPQSFFASCVANCSLEHVPRIDLALQNIRRAVKPGANVYLFVPDKDWTRQLLSARILGALGAEAAGDLIRNTLDRVFHHHHLYDAEGWRKVAEEAGFEVVSVDPVLSSATTVALETFLLPSVAGWVNKSMTTRWTNFPRIRRALAGPAYRLVQAVMSAADQTPTAEYLLIARRPATDTEPGT